MQQSEERQILVEERPRVLLKESEADYQADRPLGERGRY